MIWSVYYIDNKEYLYSSNSVCVYFETKVSKMYLTIRLKNINILKKILKRQFLFFTFQM